MTAALAWRSCWWLLAVRAVGPLLYANAQIGLIWPEDAIAPPAIVFAIFVFADAGLALLISVFVSELRPARRLIILDSLIGDAAGVAAIVLWATWPTALPPEVFVVLAGTWAFLSGLLHAAMAIPLRHVDDPQMLLILTIMSGIVRMGYGVPTAMAALVVVNPVGFRRILGIQQWLLLLFGITYLLFYAGIADSWRGRWQGQGRAQSRVPAATASRSVARADSSGLFGRWIQRRAQSRAVRVRR